MVVPILISSPPATPAPFGLLSVAAVREETGVPRFAATGIQWEPTACAEVQTSVGACVDAEDLTEDDGTPTVQGGAFTLYHLHRCRTVGSIEAAAERARESFAVGESRGIERAMAVALATREQVIDLTPVAGTPVTALTGLALLEQYAGETYGGVPVIHTPRGVTTILSGGDAVMRGAGRLETVQGSLIASGGGYARGFAPLTEPDDPAAPTAVEDLTPAEFGTAWVYVTGQVVVQRAPVMAVDPTMAGTAMRANEYLTLLQRPVALAWECITAAVLVHTADLSYVVVAGA